MPRDIWPGRKFLTFLAALLGKGVLELQGSKEPLSLEKGYPPGEREIFIDTLEKLLSWSILGYLANHGGAIPTAVIVGEERRYGRFWEAGTPDAVKITHQGLEFLILLYNALVTNSIPNPPPSLCHGGDIILAHLSLGSCLKSPEATLIESLISASPLTPLFSPIYQPQLSLSPLFSNPTDLILYYLSHVISHSWVKFEIGNMRLSAEDAMKQNSVMELLIKLYIQTAITNKKLSLLRIPILFFKIWLHEEGGMEHFYKKIKEKAYLLPNIARQENFLESYGRIISWTVRISETAEELFWLPYVDLSLRDKLFLEFYNDHFKNLSNELLTLRKRLMREI